MLFLYELTDHDDLAEIHLSPNMRKMMGNNTKEVLIGFIDEAGVTINEGSKYGHEFIGITPLIVRFPTPKYQFWRVLFQALMYYINIMAHL